MIDHTARRDRMVKRDLEGRGISDPAVLAAMREVPREAFVPEDVQDLAYDDMPLPIGQGQTISQPYIVAHMTEALGLRGGERVLDVGTGSGYAAAVLARIAGWVYSIERHADLADAARRRLERLGFSNVEVRQGDGSLGWPEHAPYDAIVVAASSPEVPPALLDQLVDGGRLVIPVGDTLGAQDLLRVVRTGEGTAERERLEAVRFVPLVGAAGWPGEGDGGPAGWRRSAARLAGIFGDRSGT